MGGVGGGRLFEGGRLLTFSAFRMGANSRLGAYSNKYGNQVFFFLAGGVLWVGGDTGGIFLFDLKYVMGFRNKGFN